MKDFLLTQAEYNKLANKALFKILEKIGQELCQKDCGIFRKNILNEASHLLGTQIAIFLGVFNEYCQNKVDCKELLAQLNDDLSLKTTDIKELAKLCELCDKKIIEIIKLTENFTKKETLKFPGINFEKSRVFLYLAILNHSTHHRAMISAALDILGVQNDFNGMLAYEI